MNMCMTIIHYYDPTRYISALLLLIALVVVIINIVNLVKAKRYLSAGNSEPGFKRFFFWPNALIFLAVLSAIIGLFRFAVNATSAAGIIKTKLETLGADVAWGLEAALFPLSVHLFMTTCLLAIYGVFRLILHWMSQRSIK